MLHTPTNTDLQFAPTHEWLLATPDQANTYTVGISDYAQQALGDVVHVTLPQIGQTVQAGEACCLLESVKAASDVHAPIAGTIVAVNTQLSDTPELINDDAYGAGWLFRIQNATPSTVHLLSTETYQQQLNE